MNENLYIDCENNEEIFKDKNIFNILILINLGLQFLSNNLIIAML